MEKQCNRCNNLKQISEFYKETHGAYGVRAVCKLCWKNDRKALFLKHKISHRHNKKRICSKCQIKKTLKHFSVQQAQCKECQKSWAENWRKTNQNYRDNTRKYEAKIKRENTVVYQNIKLRANLRQRIRMALQINTKTGSTLELIGCSIKELRTYLEAKFLPDMTWENYGLWHIDHIKPCSSFDLSLKSEQKKCFNYSNLQPLWAKDNLSKGDK